MFVVVKVYSFIVKQVKMIKYISFIIHILFLTWWFEHRNRDAIHVYLHVWYLQTIHKSDIISQTTGTSRHLTETRISCQLVIVPRWPTVPGGTTTAMRPIPMGCIPHLTNYMITCPWNMKPFVITVKVYVQWNSCLDNSVIIFKYKCLLTWNLLTIFITSLELFNMQT